MSNIERSPLRRHFDRRRIRLRKLNFSWKGHLTGSKKQRRVWPRHQRRHTLFGGMNPALLSSRVWKTPRFSTAGPSKSGVT